MTAMSAQPTPKTVLVTGATGYIGGRLVPRLIEAGHTVKVLVRSPEKIAGVPWRDKVDVVQSSLDDGDALRDADRFYGTTVHYAARVASSALGGEVLVSSLVHDLVADSGVTFRESREVELKGIDGSHRLFSLELA